MTGGKSSLDFMKYNIDFEIFGTIVILIIIVFFKLKFDRQTESEKSFMRLAYVVLIAQVTDMASAVTISIGGPDLALFNLLFDTVFFAAEVYMALFFTDYILISAYKRPVRKYRIVLVAYGAMHTLLLIFNLFYGFYYSFDFTTGDYIHENWYYALYLIPGLLAINALILIIYHWKQYDVKQWISVFCFVVFSVIGLLLQGTIIPNIYLSFGLVTVAFLMIVFSLETPDYRKLMQTMDELEEARKDAEEARREAERANSVKSDFLANMSHEIRTPINSILGFDEVILRESTDKDITQYASNIKLSGQTLLTLINDILDFSKIESGNMDIIRVDYDIRTLLADMVLMITPKAAEKGLKLLCKADERLPRTMHGDDLRIRQIIINLLTNAVKYTEKGEVVLSVFLEEEGNPAGLRFSVKDTGMGIRTEDQRELFSAFKRIDEKKNRNVEGTGLGLPICARLLELMDSELMFESEYGEGSDFYFILNQEVVDPAPVGRFDPAAEISTRNVEITHESFTAPDARILVVDDVAMNIAVFKHLLKKSEMVIEDASGGAQALDMIRTQNYDIIFMDYLMPDMDGIETLKKGREERIIDIGRTPVIALTADAVAGARDMFTSEGFSDYLTKPIQFKQLISVFLRHLPEDKIIYMQ